MIPDYTSPAGVAAGDEIARWLLQNRKQLGVKYVIWKKQIWSVQRQAEGWRPYFGISPHYDHVHVSTYGDSAGSDVVGGPGGGSSGPPVLPVASVVLTARFGQCSSLWARCHTGLDFSAGTGTPIRAVLGGRVVSSGWGGAYGQLTKIEARPGLQFWYAHQSARRVRVGQVVKTGQVIGRVGQTGNTTGAHLHLEVRVRGSAIRPRGVAAEAGGAPWLRRIGPGRRRRTRGVAGRSTPRAGWSTPASRWRSSPSAHRRRSAGSARTTWARCSGGAVRSPAGTETTYDLRIVSEVFESNGGRYLNVVFEDQWYRWQEAGEGDRPEHIPRATCVATRHVWIEYETPTRGSEQERTEP